MNAVIDFILTNLPLILCLLVGVGLLVLEVFIPGFGICGISGLVLLAVGILMTWLHYGVAAGLGVTLIALALAGICISVSVRSASHGKVAKSALILNEVIAPEENEEIEALLHREGITMTVLNPAGIAEFDGVRLNVVSEARYMEKGTKVQVIHVEGNRIVVRETKG